MSRWIAAFRRNQALATFLRFVAVGGANTLASLVVYWLALPWMPPQAAYASSFLFGVVLGYLLHTRYAFRARRGWRSFAAWPLVCLAGWAVGAGVLQLAIGPLGIDPRLAPLLSVAASVPVTFVLGRRVLAPERSAA
jgi:putative flippase GtrA